MDPVLILGGSGQAGAGTAALLRRWYPTLPLTIAGRNIERAQRVADEGAAISGSRPTVPTRWWSPRSGTTT